MLNNTEKLTILIADILTEMLANRIPSDSKFIEYKDEFIKASIPQELEHLIPSKLLRDIRTVSKMLKTSSNENFETIMRGVLEKINTLIAPVNVDFYIKFFSLTGTLEDNLTDINVKISEMENCKTSDSEVDSNVYMKIKYYNILLNMYINTMEVNVDKIKPISDKLKLLIAERNSIAFDFDR